MYYYLLHNMLYMGNASIISLPEIDWQQLLVFHQIYLFQNVSCSKNMQYGTIVITTTFWSS